MISYSSHIGYLCPLKYLPNSEKQGYGVRSLLFEPCARSIPATLLVPYPQDSLRGA